jgi:alpha-galactosidase
MPKRHRGLALFCLLAAFLLALGFPAIEHALSQRHRHAPAPRSQPLALTPPMGWNSWDSYGTTVREADVKANARWEAERLLPFGYRYIVVDMEWFVADPVAEGNRKDAQMVLDAHGRYLPAPNRFPSAVNGAGFRPLAAFVHSLGLRFGIHILQGIPREAVERNLPIAGSPFRARDAADTSATCSWNPDNYDLKPNAAGQAYYDSIVRLYASWGVDYIKADCIASRPYKGAEIRMLHAAIARSGRPIALSLSPGAAPLGKLDDLRKYANAWRISDDVWDLWHSAVPYPQGVGDQFPRAAQWAPLAVPGHWPDDDMLPLGYLGPAPGWGTARQSRLTHDEQRTLFTLWSMARSPLMMGGDLPRTDDWTLSLLTNREVLDVDQHSTGNHAVSSNDDTEVWLADDPAGGQYLAIFNLQDQLQMRTFSWRDLGLPNQTYSVRDLWSGGDLGTLSQLDLTLPPHGCFLYRVQ